MGDFDGSEKENDSLTSMLLGGEDVDAGGVHTSGDGGDSPWLGDTSLQSGFGLRVKESNTPANPLVSAGAGDMAELDGNQPLRLTGSYAGGHQPEVDDPVADALTIPQEPHDKYAPRENGDESLLYPFDAGGASLPGDKEQKGGGLSLDAGVREGKTGLLAQPREYGKLQSPEEGDYGQDDFYFPTEEDLKIARKAAGMTPEEVLRQTAESEPWKLSLQAGVPGPVDFMGRPGDFGSMDAPAAETYRANDLYRRTAEGILKYDPARFLEAVRKAWTEDQISAEQASALYQAYGDYHTALANNRVGEAEHAMNIVLNTFFSASEHSVAGALRWAHLPGADSMDAGAKLHDEALSGRPFEDVDMLGNPYLHPADVNPGLFGTPLDTGSKITGELGAMLPAMIATDGVGEVAQAPRLMALWQRLGAAKMIPELIAQSPMAFNVMAGAYDRGWQQAIRENKTVAEADAAASKAALDTLPMLGVYSLTGGFSRAGMGQLGKALPALENPLAQGVGNFMTNVAGNAGGSAVARKLEGGDAGNWEDSAAQDLAWGAMGLRQRGREQETGLLRNGEFGLVDGSKDYLAIPDTSSGLKQTFDWDTRKLKANADIPADHVLVTEGLLKPGIVNRTDLHDALVEYFMQKAIPLENGQKPIAYVTGGGAGAGKSTLLDKLNASGDIKTHGAVEVMADEIKLLLPEYQAMLNANDTGAASFVHNESVLIADKLLDHAINADGRYNVVYDTQLSRPEYAKPMFQNLKQRGFDTHLIAVTIDSKIALERALTREKETGRSISVEEIFKAHQRFNKALKSYLDLVDRAEIWDNTLKNFQLVAKKVGSKLEILNHSLYNQIDKRGK